MKRSTLVQDSEGIYDHLKNEPMTPEFIVVHVRVNTELHARGLRSHSVNGRV